MANFKSPVPLYHQVFSVLRQRIIDGTYEIGDRLKTEDEYAAEFSVSRATVRQAIGELARQGLVTRKQGRGTFVLGEMRRPLSQRSRGSLHDLIEEVKHTDILSIAVDRNAPYPKRVAKRLQMPSAIGLTIRRTRGVSTQPHSFTITYLVPTVAKLVSEEELRAEPLMVLLLKKGVPLARAVQTVRSQLADSDVCEGLGVDFGTPVLFAERLVLDVDDQPVEYIQSWYNGELYEFTVTLELSEMERRIAYEGRPSVSTSCEADRTTDSLS